jgi:hypothetical protein
MLRFYDCAFARCDTIHNNGFILKIAFGHVISPAEEKYPFRTKFNSRLNHNITKDFKSEPLLLINSV